MRKKKNEEMFLKDLFNMQSSVCSDYKIQKVDASLKHETQRAAFFCSI